MTDTSARSQITIFLIAVAAHFNSLWNGFAFDDLIHILNNPNIRSADAAWHSLGSPSYPGNLYRPFVTIVNTLTFTAAGLNPFAYHFTNVMLHGIVAVLIFQIFRRIISKNAAAMSAMIWAVLPVHTEAVANVTGRTELLSAMFILCSLLLALSPQRISRLMSGAALFIALCCKESALVAIPIYLLVAVAHGKEFNRPALLSMLIATIGFLLIRSTVVVSDGIWNALDNPFLLLPWYSRIFFATALLGKYAQLTVFPYKLSADYSWALIRPDVTASFLFLFVLTLWLILWAFKNLRFRPHISFGVTWFFFAFAITSNILFPIGTIFAERLVYLPSAGLALLLGCLVSKRPYYLLPAVVLCGIYSNIHDTVWRSNGSLWQYQIKISPESAKTLSNYGVVLRNSGKLDEAGDHFRKAISIAPRYAEAIFNLASIYAEKNISSGAEHWLHETLVADPTYIPAINLLGRVYLKRGDVGKAESSFRKSLEINPNDLEALSSLYMIENQLANNAEADRLRQRIRKVNPGYNFEK